MDGLRGFILMNVTSKTTSMGVIKACVRQSSSGWQGALLWSAVPSGQCISISGASCHPRRESRRGRQSNSGCLWGIIRSCKASPAEIALPRCAYMQYLSECAHSACIDVHAPSDMGVQAHKFLGMCVCVCVCVCAAGLLLRIQRDRGYKTTPGAVEAGQTRTANGPVAVEPVLSLVCQHLVVERDRGRGRAHVLQDGRRR